jgi:hypothetical protein
MSKRKNSDERCGDRASKRPVQQHLYLLLDDWERGYSIHSLDADAALSPKQFTEPPIARIEAPHVRSWNFVSHGSKIFAMKAKEFSPAIPAFDARTLAMIMCPWPSCRADHVTPPLRLRRRQALPVPGRPHRVPRRPAAVRQRRRVVLNGRRRAASAFCYAVHPDGRTLFVSAAPSPSTPSASSGRTAVTGVRRPGLLRCPVGSVGRSLW